LPKTHDPEKCAAVFRKDHAQPRPPQRAALYGLRSVNKTRYRLVDGDAQHMIRKKIMRQQQ
jgi:hypothetical protein